MFVLRTHVPVTGIESHVVATAASDTGGSGVRIPACGRPLRTYIAHLLFDASPGASAWRNPSGDDAALRVQFHLRNRSKRIALQRHEVVLELTLNCRHGQDAVYRAEVHQAGLFELPAIAEAERDSILHTDCARVLFPLAKQVADGLVRDAGFPPFRLPPIDFDAIHARHREAAADPAPMRQLREFWHAVTRLQASGRVSPRPHDFHAMHGESLSVAQRSREALPAADRVLAQSPDDPATLEMLSAVYSMNNAHQRAVEVYRRAVSARPGDARAHYNLATSLMFTGDLVGAEHEIDLCIECQPTFWDAYSVRSKVRRQTRPENHVDDLRTLLKRHGDQTQACERLNMALAKEYEDLGDYAQAFEHMVAGNEAGKRRRRYDIARDEALFEALLQYIPRTQAGPSGVDGNAPIFVFGMPRSGTTLVDRILSSHPEVTSAGELKQFSMLLKYLSGSPTEDLIDTDTITRAGNLDWNALGTGYLADTQPVFGQTPRFVDKFTHHFLYAGYIARALPNARMICVRRNPMDTCLGNFSQVFSETSPFHGYACDLLDTGRYYVQFDRLMTHWRNTLPGRILEVPYESLVEHQEATTRALLEFCGLAWDPVCLAFENNRAPVATASAVQVRSPVYRDAMQRWRTYAEQLAPLQELLTHAGIVVPS